MQDETDQEARSEIARQLAGMREQVQGVCAVCGTPFVGTKKRKYCSDRCSWRAWNERHPGARRKGSRHEEEQEGSSDGK